MPNPDSGKNPDIWSGFLAFRIFSCPLIITQATITVTQGEPERGGGGKVLKQFHIFFLNLLSVLLLNIACQNIIAINN